MFILKILYICAFKACGAGDKVLLHIKSRDLWFRAGQKGDLEMKCLCYTGVLDFTVGRIETLVLKDTACQPV